MRRMLCAAGARGALAVAVLATAAGCTPSSPDSNDPVFGAPQRFEPGAAEPDPLATLADPELDEPDVWPLVGAPARAPRNIAGLMFDIGGGPPNATMIDTLLNGAGASLRHMYQEISYGMQDLNIELLGPFTLPQPTCLPIICCGPKTNQPNGPEALAVINGLPKRYDHYFYVYGRIPAGADCGTWGDEGQPANPAVYSSYSFHGLVGYSQELGHNFGMTHEPVMTCPNNAVFLDDPSQCTHVEYGSTLSFMGNGPGHPSAYHKVQQGWLSKCNGVKVGASATFTLLPQELACDGVQILQIPAPKSRPSPAAGNRQGRAVTLTHYYVELRTPRGFDAMLTRPAVTPMVVISIGPDFETARAAPYVYVLDQNPGGSINDAGLRSGQTYQDPAGGLSITVGTIDENHADVTVTLAGQGNDTCLDGTPFTPPGPTAASCGALGGAGAGGTAGSAGMGGGGAAGAAGAGTGGTSGASGAAGLGAAAGLGGSAGQSGTAGSSGAAVSGAGGSSGSSGASGSGVSGSAGESAGGSGTTPEGGSVSAGCSCRAAREPAAAGVWWLVGIAFGAVAARRRQRLRARREGSDRSRS